ncbi:hypothetical protein GMORB2_6496 [Geosmithia morbida]|uniref:Protein phosphatase n=1 Tax=Geosmithia morbida TaxID=1094350 RepID=A0A9P4YTR4_9HYPO|nr:uncharacterized protein GMORB2_6496 [Geosmithia morbida]KAF4122948.1 hypothetical protein GMORB2_6496 [Geosmithia morbida]
MRVSFPRRAVPVPWRLTAKNTRTKIPMAYPRSTAAGLRLQRRPYSTSSSLGKYTYHIAASFIAKDRPYDPNRHVFHYDHETDARPAYARPFRIDSGHDSFFISQVNGTGAVALGVADGVGGWVDSGVDPGDFSHGLCSYMADAARDFQTRDPNGRLTPRKIMQHGYDAVCRDRTIRAGGSTACVAVADPDGTLDVANLGDSGFLQLRRNAIHRHSEPQTHAFNTPFQLSRVPPSVASRMAAYGGAQLSDLPEDADVTQHQVRHGDVLIFATDGVLDNLFNQDILRIASRIMISTGAWEVTEAEGVRASDELTSLTEADDVKNPVTLQSALATQIVGFANRASTNTRLEGPFAKEVKKYYPYEEWHGGKVDDITVVVAVVDGGSNGVEFRSKL